VVESGWIGEEDRLDLRPGRVDAARIRSGSSPGVDDDQLVATLAPDQEGVLAIWRPVSISTSSATA